MPYISITHETTLNRHVIFFWVCVRTYWRCLEVKYSNRAKWNWGHVARTTHVNCSARHLSSALGAETLALPMLAAYHSPWRRSILLPSNLLSHHLHHLLSKHSPRCRRGAHVKPGHIISLVELSSARRVQNGIIIKVYRPSCATRKHSVTRASHWPLCQTDPVTSASCQRVSCPPSVPPWLHGRCTLGPSRPSLARPMALVAWKSRWWGERRGRCLHLYTPPLF